MKKIIIFLCICFSVVTILAQPCNSVRGGKIRMYCLDSLTTYAGIHKYNFYIYYNAATICGDTIRCTKYSNKSVKLQPINGTDINSDGILDGVLVNPSTRMCLFEIIDTIPAYGTRTITVKAGKFVPAINNVANSSTLNMFLHYTVLVSPTMTMFNKKSIVYSADCLGTNTVGINYQYNPQPLNPDMDSISFSLMPFASGATNPGSSGTFSINAANGKVTWNAPTTAGLNNFGIQSNEMRLHFSLGQYFTVGTGENIIQVTTAGSTGIENLLEVETKPFVFPNPTTGKIHIVNNNALPDNQPCLIIIRNIEGKIIKKTETLFNNEILLDTDLHESGVYTYEITRSNYSFQKSSFIIQR